jgi:hypothetical protein
MAARAHAVHDYSSIGASERPRRQVWLRDEDYDAVVLPRGHQGSISGALILSAVLASVLVGGAAYGVYVATTPAAAKMAETPAIPLDKSWQVDPAVTQANVAFALKGRPVAQTAAAAAAPILTPADLPALQSRQAELPASSLDGQHILRKEVVLDDAAPGFQESLPQPNVQTAPLVDPKLPEAVMPKPEAPVLPEPPYPNPTTTPPEMTQPPVDSGLGTPKTDPQNPY